MGALSKAAIASLLSDKMDFSKTEAIAFVDEFFEEIRTTLESGEDVHLSSFGNFVLRDKAKRPGKNPKTGEVVDVSARRVVTFRPGLKLKAKIDRLVTE